MQLAVQLYTLKPQLLNTMLFCSERQHLRERPGPTLKADRSVVSFCQISNLLATTH